MPLWGSLVLVATSIKYYSLFTINYSLTSVTCIFHFSFYNLLYEPRQHHPPIRRSLGVCHGCNLIFQGQSWQEELL